MSSKPSRLSAIARIWSLLSEPQHPYNPTTSVFVDLNVNRIADELQLQKRGAERGIQNRPATNSSTYDDVEHEIVERIEGHKQASYNLLLEHFDTYAKRLTALNFEALFTVIKQAAPQAVGDFRAEATLGRNELFGLRRRVVESEAEREVFRARHKLIRPARLANAGKVTLKVGLLAILFVIEVAINGSFLAQSNLGGLLGGAVQATSFAALNIIASFLFGLALVRLINRRNFFLKFIGLISFFSYLAFAVVLNLTLAHLREVPPSVAGDVGQEVLTRLRSNPLNLSDVNDWVFFGVGFIFSLIAMADGLLFFDPYIGYAGLERRWTEATTSFTDREAELIERLQEIRNDATEVMSEAAHNLAVRRSEYDNILQSRTGLAQLFAQHQEHLERACRALLAIYREANRHSRNTAAPPHFSKPHVIDRIAAGPSGWDDPSVRERLLQNILKTQEVLEGQSSAIHDAFEEAVRSYREIETMILEKKSG